MENAAGNNQPLHFKLEYGCYHVGMAYGQDFRYCVVENIASGMSWSDASRIFKISYDTIGRWLRKHREGIELCDAPRKEYKKQKVDKEQLVRMVEEHPDATLEELAQPFGVAHSVIDYHLRKLGITRKKNHALSGAKRRKKTKVSVRNRGSESG